MDSSQGGSGDHYEEKNLSAKTPSESQLVQEANPEEVDLRSSQETLTSLKRLIPCPSPPIGENWSDYLNSAESSVAETYSIHSSKANSSSSSRSISPASSYCALTKEQNKISRFFSMNHLYESFSGGKHHQPDGRRIPSEFYTFLREGKAEMLRKTIARNLKKFVSIPVPIGLVFKCRITRTNEDEFYLRIMNKECLDEQIMAARKTYGNFEIFTHPVDLAKPLPIITRSLVGCLTPANFLRSKYTLYETGSKKPDGSGDEPLRKYRRELGAVVFNGQSMLNNIFNWYYPARSVNILIPAMTNNESQRFQQSPNEYERKKNITLKNYKKGFMYGICELMSRKPNAADQQQSQRYSSLPFHTKNGIPSSKNFQIIHPKIPGDGDDLYVILEMVRLSQENTFALEFSYPLCPLQAFGIALSLF